MEEESQYYPFPSPCASTTAGEDPSPPDPVTARSPDPSLSFMKERCVLEGDHPSSSTTTSSDVSSTWRQRKKKRQQQQRKGVVVGAMRRRAPRGCRGDVDVQDLGLPLGMSIAAVISQVLDGTNSSRNKLPVDRLSLVCTSAVKESVSNIFGDRFDSFLMNFENSFHSTLKTLYLINGTSVSGKGRRSSRHVSVDRRPNKIANETSFAEQENIIYSSLKSTSDSEAVKSDHNHEATDATSMEHLEKSPQASVNNQLILHGQINRELARASHGFANPGFSQAVFSTFEKSVMEQTRSNDLKAFEIGLISRKLQLKESQLALNSYANMLEKVKICMGISKATFKEQKLKNQMLDSRYAELQRTCIDLLAGGLFIMSGFLTYGAYVFSYERITEATTSCSAIAKESTSWWVPKSVSSFSSVWLMLRCQVIALSRLTFGLLMILVIGYAIFQRSVTSGPSTMPGTFFLILLGPVCGFFGKLCLDTLGGSGYHWVILWLTFCLLHFLANVYPWAFHYVLYGPLTISHAEVKSRLLVPYWLRRFAFYLVLSIVYPLISGLLPFASFDTWKKHFGEKIISLWDVHAQIEV